MNRWNRAPSLLLSIIQTSAARPWVRHTYAKEDQIGEKVLSKVAEVLGCDVELLAANVAHIEKK